MKKNNVNTIVKKISAVMASAFMAVTAMSMTVSADCSDNVINSVDSITPTIELRNVEGTPGGTAVVQVIPVSGNTCTCYDFLLEYNPRLELEIEDVAGANSYEIFEVDGKKYVSLVGFTAGVYEDGEPMATLNFHLPADAAKDEDFGVRMAKLTTFASDDAEFEIEVPSEAAVSTVTCETENGLKTFQTKSDSGMLMNSSVGLRGDANEDGVTNVRDAAFVARHLASRSDEISEKGRFLADVDDNGILNVRDAAKIARYVANGSVSWD